VEEVPVEVGLAVAGKVQPEEAVERDEEKKLPEIREVTRSLNLHKAIPQALHHQNRAEVKAEAEEPENLLQEGDHQAEVHVMHCAS
jgi:hypothetical protein